MVVFIRSSCPLHVVYALQVGAEVHSRGELVVLELLLPALDWTPVTINVHPLHPRVQGSSGRQGSSLGFVTLYLVAASDRRGLSRVVNHISIPYKSSIHPGEPHVCLIDFHQQDLLISHFPPPPAASAARISPNLTLV